MRENPLPGFYDSAERSAFMFQLEFTSRASRGRDRLHRVSRQTPAASRSLSSPPRTGVSGKPSTALAPDHIDGYRVGEEAVCLAHGKGTALQTGAAAFLRVHSRRNPGLGRVWPRPHGETSGERGRAAQVLCTELALHGFRRALVLGKSPLDFT